MDKLFQEVEADTRIDNEKALVAMSAIGIKKVEVSGEELVRWQAVADGSVQNLIGSGEISPEAVQVYLDNLQSYRSEAPQSE